MCLECYGTGEKQSDVALDTCSGKEKVAEGVRLVKQKDYVAAFLAFREAVVKHHNAEALRRLGARYMNGNAVYANVKRANALYCAAANAGDVKSLYILGENILEGKGVGTKGAEELNRSEARRLLEIAYKKGCDDAKTRYLEVAAEKLAKTAPSGVVGWRGNFDIPKFLLEADPAAEQKEKNEKEAARKAEEARKAREQKRKIRNINLCRGLWWFLFRVAATGTYFICLKDCYKDLPQKDMSLLVALFFIASYIIRPNFGGVCYFFVGLAVPIAAVVYNSTNPMASFCLFTVMVTFFMRWMGEKLKLPLITYPLLGAMVGFCSSPFAISHNVFNVTPWWFSTLGLSILFFLVNMGMSGNNGNGVVAKGARKTSWVGTFWLLAICGLASAYIAVSASGESYKFSWEPSVEVVSETMEEKKNAVQRQNDDGLYEKGMECLNRKQIDTAEMWLKKAAEKGDVRATEALKKMK